MANIKAAEKKIKVIAKKNMINKSRKSEIKTYIKKFNTAIDENDKEKAQSLFQTIQKKFHQAVSKNTFHQKTVDRKIGSLNKKLNSI